MNKYTFNLGLLLLTIIVSSSAASNAGGKANSSRSFKTEQAAIDEIAKQVASQLQRNAVQTVFVRHFRGPGTNELQLTNLLIKALDDLFEIGPGGVEVEGRIRPMPGSDNGPPLGYQINVNIEGPDDSISYPGSSVSVSSDIDGHLKLSETDATRPQPPAAQGEPFNDITTNKPPIEHLIKGTRIYPHPSSPYSMEILIKNEATGKFEPRTPFTQDGVLAMNLERGETYKVRVYNDSIYESFAKLNIDGLGRFALSEDSRKRRNIDLVRSRQPRDFKGYYLNASKAASFVVGEYEESVAKQILGDAPDIGTISVAFGVSYTGPMPEYEKETKTVTRQETTTVMVPQIITIPRTITETVPVPGGGGFGGSRTPRSGPTTVQGNRQTKSIPYSHQRATNDRGGFGGGGSNVGGTVQRQRTVYEQKTVMVPRQQTRTIAESRVVGTTEGPAVTDNVGQVSRKFGLTRAVIKLRYFANAG